MRKSNLIWVIFILIAFSFSTYIAYLRHQMEISNRTVEITMDYTELRQIADYENKDLKEVLREFKKNGLVSVALTEEVMDDLIKEEKIKIISPFELRLPNFQFPTTPEYLGIHTKEKNLRERLIKNLKLKWGKDRVKSLGDLIIIKGRIENIKEITVGLNPEDMIKIKKSGLKIIPRYRNYYLREEEALREVFSSYKSNKEAVNLIFWGEEILGYEKDLKKIANLMKKYNLNFGYIEFSKQKGEDKLSKLVLPNVVRVHSINLDELKKISPTSARERFVRGVKERNIRICYLHPYPAQYKTTEVIKFNLNYVASLKKELERAGFKISSPQILREINIPKYFFCFIFLGVLSAGIIFLDILLNLKLRDKILIILVVSLFIIFSTWVTSFLWTKKLLALTSAVLFPLIGILLNTQKNYPPDDNYLIIFKKTFKLFILTTLVTIGGGLIIAGILSELSFILKIDQFTGVKIAHLLPLFIIGLFFTLVKPAEILPSGEEIKKRVYQMFQKPLKIEHLIFFVMLVVVILLMLLRTGNEPGTKVLEIESLFRQKLEDLFFIRPRTKEFLIGHPALLLSYFLFLKKRRRYLPLFFTLGTIGQVSLINTFCHLHTPIFYSLLRTFWGIILGMILGILLLVIFIFIEKYVKLKDIENG